MDNELIIKAAMVTVGVVQILKNFITLKNGKLWTIPTMITAVIASVIGEYFSPKVLDIVLVVCIASLFYDSIFKTLENLAHSFVNKGNNTVEEK